MEPNDFRLTQQDKVITETAEDLAPLVSDTPDAAALALAIAFQYAGYDGGHHKQWVIDQMVNALAGEKYPQFLEVYNHPEYDEWDQGIAP